MFHFSNYMMIGQNTARPGQVEFIIPGNYKWEVPLGVYSVSVVCVGAGTIGFLGAGALAWGNNIFVAPEEIINIQVGNPNSSTAGDSSLARASFFRDRSILLAEGGNTVSGQQANFSGSAMQGGGRGGVRNGGAGGYMGDGANGSAGVNTNGVAAPPGGGAGAGSYLIQGSADNRYPGGGVGIYGQGPSGGLTSANRGGKGGSGGGDGYDSQGQGTGLYGGSGGRVVDTVYRGRGGAVRILWGPNRNFPATNTGDF